MKKISALIFPILLVGCSTSTVKVAEQMNESPKLAKTNLTHAFKCVRNNLQDSNNTRGFSFVIGEIADGTVKQNYSNGPLSDAWQIELKSSLTQLVPLAHGITHENFPPIFQHNKGKFGLNEFGATPTKQVNIFNSQVLAAIKKHNPNVENVVPLIINGSFTRFDGDYQFQGSRGFNIGNEGRDGDGEFNFGTAKSAQSISLTINLSLPGSNFIISSQSFSVNSYRENNKYTIKLALGESFLGFTNEELIVEGIHGAQKALIDAAALWIVHKAFDKNANVNSCLMKDQKEILSGV